MSRGVKLAVWVAIVAAIVGLGWFVVDRVYVRPAGELSARIAQLEGGIAAYERQRGRRSEISARSAAVVGRTLAGDTPRVQHEFRLGLAALAEAAGLGAVEVSTGTETGVANPISEARLPRSERSLRGLFARGDDFRVIRGEVRGEGDLSAVARAVALAEAQPWLHRIEGVLISPVGGDATRRSVRLDVATIYFGAEGGLASAEVVGLGDEAAGAAQVLASSSAFGVRAAQVVEKPAPKPRRAAPPAAPPERWRLAGVVATGERVEVWCVRLDRPARRVLAIGDRVAGFELVSVRGDSAVFSREGVETQVLPGEVIAPAG